MSPRIQKKTKPRIIVHGGAGNITRTNLPPSSYAKYSSFLLSTLHSAHSLLEDGSSALDAATHAVSLLEDCPLFNCGKGAVFTRAGTNELEASVMLSKGYRKRGVGVSLLKRVKNPIKLAMEMLIRGEEDVGGGGNGGNGDPSGGSGGAQGHCHLSGEYLEGLAKDWGMEMVEERYFWTKKRWDEHRRGLAKEGSAEVEDWEEKAGYGQEDDLLGGVVNDDPGWDGKEYLPQGTVGCVCLDQYGSLCVATSTGGLTNKLPGRIGDTPTLGAGFWAEEWSPVTPTILYQQPIVPTSALVAIVPDSLKRALGDCFPFLSGFSPIPTTSPEDYKHDNSGITRAAALSGTGNGDSFLRLAAVRTAIAIARFSGPPNHPLSACVSRVAGPGGELQKSAGERWGKTGEGEGGMIGIELVGGEGKVVWDFNCGGMFRAWIDVKGAEKVGVFRGKY